MFAQTMPFDALKESIASMIRAALPAAVAGISATTARWSDMAIP
jgi:hypothetical protein